MGIDRKQFEKKLELAVKKKADLSRLKKSTLDQVGKTIIAEMLQRIGSGISPITGKRFPAYKNPKRYPGNRKPKRPVNLFLTGDFLNNLKFRIKTGKIPVITILFSKKSEQIKELGHREGAGGQPKRPIIPRGNESFTDGILVSMRRALSRLLDKDLK